MKKYILIGAFVAFMYWMLRGGATKSPKSIATGNVDAMAYEGFEINGEHVD